MIHVSLIEDDRVTRESLATLIGRDPALSCLGTYGSAEEALHHIHASLPDVLLVDIHLPGKSGIECVASLKARHPQLQVLMLTTYDDSDFVFEALRAGASGYLLKRNPSADILDAIKEVHAGGSPMSAIIARKVVSYFQSGRKPPGELQTLTARENEILRHLSMGLHYKEIADQLQISTSTVRAHLHTIYGKLHVQSRTEAVIKYLKRS